MHLLISKEGFIKLGDFELACYESKLNEIERKEQEGTPYWMAPEVITYNLEKINSSSVDDNINSIKVSSVDFLDKKSKDSDEYKIKNPLNQNIIEEDEQFFFKGKRYLI